MNIACGCGHGYPVEIPCRQLTREKVFIISQNDSVAVSVDPEHIGRLLQSESQTFALSDCIVDDTLVSSHD